MNTPIRKALIASGLLATCIVGGAIGGSMLNGVASAQTSDSTITAPANSDDTRPARGPRMPKEELTGENATKAIAAAKAAVADAKPVGVHSGPDGGYHVGMQKTDGTHVHVVLDDEFKVVETKEGGPRGRGHRGPRGPRPEGPATGESSTAA